MSQNANGVHPLQRDVSQFGGQPLLLDSRRGQRAHVPMLQRRMDPGQCFLTCLEKFVLLMKEFPQALGEFPKMGRSLRHVFRDSVV